MKTGILHPLLVRARALTGLRLAMTVFAALAAAALVFIVVDAVIDLSALAREMVLIPLIGILLGGGVMAVLQWRRLHERRLARLLEHAHPGVGTRLTNAVQFSERPAAAGIEEYLRRAAIELGRASAAPLRIGPALRLGLWRSGAFLGAVVAAWLALALFDAEVLRAVLPRFIDPRGDHPPFSRLKLEVIPMRGEVLYGGSLEVRARVSGRHADRLWLACESGTNATRAIMFLAPDKSFFQTLANLREPAEFFVTDGRARSRRFPIKIRYTPQITLVELTARWPDYTGKPERTTKLGDEPYAFPAGTRVGFRVASNRELKSGLLTLTPVLGGNPSSVRLDHGPQSNSVSGIFTLAEPTAFSITVHDTDGLENREPPRGRINVLPDEKPRLFVLEPGRNAVATPGIRVPVRVQASDDYGVTRVVWLRGLNRSIERPFNMQLTLKGGPNSVESVGAFALDDLGVRPGDVIDYYFEAADNFPGGPNVVLSRLFRLEIIEREQYEAILRQAAARRGLFEPYLKLDAWLQRLAERSRRLAAGEPKSPDQVRAEAEAIEKELARYEQELGKLLQNPAMFDVEQSFRTTLVAQHTRLGQARSALAKALGGGVPGSRELSDLSDVLGQFAKQEAEQVGEPAKHIASVAQVLARADTFVQLAQQQAALAQLLRRFSEKSGQLSRMEQMELQELTHQQERIDQALRLWTEQLPELLAQVPDEPEFTPLRNDVNTFLEAVAAAGIQSDLSNAAEALAEPAPLRGFAQASAAAEKMDRLIARCNGLGSPGNLALEARFGPKLNEPGMGNSLQQILAAMGVGTGMNGRDGYGMFNENVGLYGPNVPVTGEQASGRGPTGRADFNLNEEIRGGAEDPALSPAQATGRVRLQPNAKFPMQYRELVGDYFRVIAESQEGENR